MQDVKVYDRQREPLSQLARQGRFPAAGAADNDDTLRRHSSSPKETDGGNYPTARGSIRQIDLINHSQSSTGSHSTRLAATLPSTRATQWHPFKVGHMKG
jgi:hypothetical protein